MHVVATGRRRALMYVVGDLPAGRCAREEHVIGNRRRESGLDRGVLQSSASGSAPKSFVCRARVLSPDEVRMPT